MGSVKKWMRCTFRWLEYVLVFCLVVGGVAYCNSSNDHIGQSQLADYRDDLVSISLVSPSKALTDVRIKQSTKTVVTKDPVTLKDKKIKNPWSYLQARVTTKSCTAILAREIDEKSVRQINDHSIEKYVLYAVASKDGKTEVTTDNSPEYPTLSDIEDYLAKNAKKHDCMS